ncbi:MAG: NAD(P)/FAD-dependent oxidoreductase [Balneolaceae bacterium]|nr:NAD(P)/FAD-dependent oxidoreductase [Balneolaceae bacterium]
MSADRHHSVIVAGGGAVGLLLGLALQREGVDCLVAERRSEPVAHSRSLGIHPVSLELFDELGLAEPFLEEGVHIRRGVALDGRRRLGTVTFERCPPPYRFILSLPQYRTEALLEKALAGRAPGALVRGMELAGYREESGGVTVEVVHEGRRRTLTCELLVGCDGKESAVRRGAGIAWEGGPYPHTYAMGDFRENTGFGSDAAVFLCRQGLVESFPLPGGHRRWVVKTRNYMGELERPWLVREINLRTGHNLEGEEHVMLGSFGVQRYLAGRAGRGHVFLAGDAAQVVSPIGGQGMNLGWLQARDLARTLGEALERPGSREKLAEAYSRRSRRRARKAIRRAEFNMWLGRRSALAPLRNALVAAALHTPLSHFLARMFTMRRL